MGRACDHGVYPYQLPLEGRSGPWAQAEGRKLLMLSSYDYLGLIGDPRVDEAAIEAIRKYGTGTGGARMLTGTIELHRELEQYLARFKNTAQAISFSSGYLANLAIMAGLLTPQDRVVLDALCHRSIVDACRLAGVPIQRYRHNDLDSLRHELAATRDANRTLIVAEGVFSMDGDICPLPELIEIKRSSGSFLMIDESHAIGVLGATGRGTEEHFGISGDEIDIWSSSLTKSIPSTGGFVAVSQEIAVYLQHAASPFIFSAATSPPCVAAALAGFTILREEPDRIARLKRNADFLRDGLRELGFDTGHSNTPIVPVLLKDEKEAALMAGRLRETGVFVTPILFPAVPMGTGRLRLCVTAGHTIEDLEFGLRAFREVR